MKAKPKMEKKKYKIRILMECGTPTCLTEELEAESFHASERGYFYFSVQGKGKYYPINNTIVEEIDDERIF